MSLTFVCTIVTSVSFDRPIVGKIGDFPNCDSNSCEMPHRMQGHVVFPRMTSIPLEVSGGCKLPQQRLPSYGGLVIANGDHPPEYQEIGHLSSQS
jgi:hypothetical protein